MYEGFIAEAIQFRRYLHQHPEVSGKEKESSAYIRSRLKDCRPDELIEFENYGLAAVYHGIQPGKTVLIRGDFDALPIPEENDMEYRSVHEGVSHKCGHDGHAAILYGLANEFNNQRPERGKVVLLFQPAEENGEGAKGILQDPGFEKLRPHYAVALHNLPGYPKHAVIYKEGSFTAAANSMIIRLRGKTAHAAEPESGINPAMAMADITRKFHELNVPELDREDFRVITPIYYTLGEKSYGVSAGYGEMHFTLRAWRNEVIEDTERQCEELARKIAGAFGLKCEVSWTEKFFANENHTGVVEAIRESAQKMELKLICRENPFKWGEDFGIFTGKFPGAMFGLGAGTRMPALHNPDYDFPDEIIRTGIGMFQQIIHKLN